MMPAPALQVSLAELQGYQVAADRLHLDRLFRRGLQSASGRVGPQTGRGLEFREVRAYQPGDEPRYLDWKVTARRGQPYTRTFHEEHQRPVMLFVDLASQLQFGRVGSKAVLAARLAALLGWSAVLDKDRVGGWIQTDQQSYWQAPVDTRSRYIPFLNRLADCTAQLGALQPRPAGQLDAALEAFSQRLPRNSLVLLISDFVGWQDTGLLQRLARRFPLQLLHLTDPLDQALPQEAGAVEVDGQRLPLTDALRRDWAMAFTDRQQALRKALGHRGSYLTLSTTADEQWMQEFITLAPLRNR